LSHILEFLDLVDTPNLADYSTVAGYPVAVNSGGTALEFVLGVNADAIQGNAVQTGVPSEGQVLIYDATTDNRWEPITPPWLPLSGGTLTGFLTLHAAPENNLHAVTKKWVDDNFSPAGHDHDGDYIEALGGTPVAGNLTKITDADTLVDSGILAVDVADLILSQGVTKFPTGVEDDFRANTSFDFVDATRTFTLEVKDDVEYWIAGKKYFLDTGDDPTIQLNAAIGEHRIYLKDDGTLGEIDDWKFSTLLQDNVYLCAIDLAAIVGEEGGYEAIYIGDERHDLMNPLTHRYLHTRFGAYIEDGLGLTDITADGNGSADSHATVGVAAGTIIDEDLIHTIATQSSPAQIPVFYLLGSGPTINRAPVTNAPIYAGASTLYYNQFTGGAWRLTQGNNNNYIYYWILATNDHDQPIISVMGQNVYGNVNAARAAAATEVASIVALLEFEEFHFIGGLLYKTNSSMTNTWHAAIVSDEDGNDYYDLRSATLGSGSPPTSHSGLSDRDAAGSHPATAIATTTTNFDSLLSSTDVDVQLALDTLNDVDDSDIPLSGTHTQNLALQTMLSGAMNVLDNLDDGDIRLAGTYTDLLAGDISLANALAAIDDIPQGLTMNNNAVIKGKNSSGTAIDMAQVSGDEIVFGDGGEDYQLPGYLKGNGIYLEAETVFLRTTGKTTTAFVLSAGADHELLVHQPTVLDNTMPIQGEVAAGSNYRDLITLDSSDQVVVGDSAAPLFLNSSAAVTLDQSLLIPNAKSVYFKDSGSTSRKVIEVTSGDVANVGNANLDLVLLSSGIIDAGANDIETTGDVIAPISDHRRNIMSYTKALTLGGATSFAQCYVDAAPSSGVAIVHYDIEVKDASDIQVEGGIATFVMRRVAAGQTGVVASSGVAQTCSTGTLTVTPVMYTATAGLMVIRFNVASTGLTTPTAVLRCSLEGNADRTINWL